MTADVATEAEPKCWFLQRQRNDYYWYEIRAVVDGARGRCRPGRRNSDGDV